MLASILVCFALEYLHSNNSFITKQKIKKLFIDSTYKKIKYAIFSDKIMVCLMMMLQVVCAEGKIMCIEREREALLQFKAALLDPYGMLSSWTTSDCCQWQGIRCSNLTAHVLMLDLHGDFNDEERYMRGEIHKSLMELQQLNYLNLSSNDFQGRGIPEFLGSLTNLRYLDLSFSDFEGKIPTQFGSLSHSHS